MFVGLHFAEDGFDFAVAADDESGALGAHVGFAVHAFFHPHAIRRDDLFVLIHEQRERERVFGDELRVALRGVDADAEDRGLAREVAPRIAQSAGLRGAAGRVVFRIEIKDDVLAFEVGEFHRLPIAVTAADGGGVKRGRFAAGLELLVHRGA